MDYVWLIVIMAAAAILPDVLRRKRKYPKRNGPIPIPPRKEEVKRKRQSLQQPVKATETVQDKKENPTAPTAGKKMQRNRHWHPMYRYRKQCNQNQP